MIESINVRTHGSSIVLTPLVASYLIIVGPLFSDKIHFNFDDDLL